MMKMNAGPTANNEASTLVSKSKVGDEDFDSESDVEMPSKEFSDISAHPLEVLSHFIVISDSNIKTPKYRCKCCKYEFTASSTTRLKQHIMGYEVYTNDTPKKIVKDIKECSNPYPPLKEALIAEFNTNRAHKRPRESHIHIDGEEGGTLNTPHKSSKKKPRNSEANKTPGTVTWNEASISAREYGEVCSKGSFDEQCPEFHYSDEATLQPNNSYKNDHLILEWLEFVLGDWISVNNHMANRQGSSLRFPTYELMKAVTFLNENYFLNAYNASFDSTEAVMAIDRFASRNLNQSSMTAETIIPETIDTTNATQVKELYSSIGKYVNGRGRVDFGVVGRVNGNIRCIVEVNEQLTISQGSNKTNGFWEMMHDLVHTYYFNGAKAPLFGILTDYRHWIFFKLEGTNIEYSNPFTFFHGSLESPEITDQIYPLFKLLFEIFNVSHNCNLKTKNETINVMKKNYAEISLLPLKDNIRIAQEIKKKDDEIVRLKEELAKLKSKPTK